MNEAAILVFAGISCVLAAVATMVALLVLRRVAAIGAETAAIKKVIEFASLEIRRQELSQSVKAWEESISAVKDDARRLGLDLSRIFAGVASVLNETHKLEGNPHPKIDARQLHDINQRLLSIGESSLSATRVAESLSEKGRTMSESVEGLRKQIEAG